MRHSDADIYDYQAPYLINWLYSFLGPTNVDKALAKYQRTLRMSGPIVSEYSLRHRHPWWNAFMMYFQLRRSAKSIKRNLTAELKVLAADAKKIAALRKFMPPSVERKYQRDLMDIDRARDYLFEIQIAWHFYLQGNDLQWYADDGQKHPEFLVKTSDFEFNVECKRISVDISRQVKRRDFHRLVQELLPEIEKRGYAGAIDIALAGRLEGSHVSALASDIMGLIKSGRSGGKYIIPLGQVSFKPAKKKRQLVNGVEQYEKLRMSLADQSHAAIFSSQIAGDCIIDPIVLTVKSERPDKVPDGILEKLRRAAKDQLDVSVPGIIVCFLEGVYDLRELKSDSGLQLMTSALFEKKVFSHIAAVGYSSEIHVHKLGHGETYDNQSLVFKNANCRFKEVKDYKFTSAVIE
ncbi:MAG: hypothetical protein ACYS74_13510 [Planctomycetota bacterium]|jgi:hypothetical protein